MQGKEARRKSEGWMTNRILENDFDVALEGQVSQATIVFTDLKDFTAMSESLAPDELAAVLAGYFNKTARAILADHGPIIKYIGDAMNLASRLEGLNKQLGTDVLLSEATRKQLGEALLLRRTGRFMLAGKEHPVEVHELLGLSDDSPRPAWLAEFAAGLAKFEEEALDLAEDQFRRTGEERPGRDRLSGFYLKQNDALRPSGIDRASWNGVVRMDAK
jgi:class 3 adenylate cyclase